MQSFPSVIDRRLLRSEPPMPRAVGRPGVLPRGNRVKARLAAAAERVLSMREQIELRKLRILGVKPAAAAKRMGLPAALVARFYGFVGIDCKDTHVSESMWFGELVVPEGEVIRCPNPQCRARQQYYIPGQPCRACRIREYARQIAADRETQVGIPNASKESP